MSLLGLSRREAWWKDAEILMLRHQLAVALRERPRAHSRLTWPDRVWLALARENESWGYRRVHGDSGMAATAKLAMARSSSVEPPSLAHPDMPRMTAIRNDASWSG